MDESGTISDTGVIPSEIVEGFEAGGACPLPSASKEEDTVFQMVAAMATQSQMITDLEKMLPTE